MYHDFNSDIKLTVYYALHNYINEVYNIKMIDVIWLLYILGNTRK
jgi:hypothetical protein